MSRAQLLLMVGVVIVAVSGLVLTASLIRGNRQHTRFTQALRTAQSEAPDVIPGGVQMTDEDTSEKVAAIDRIYQVHNDAWCQGDGQRYASVFTEDADFVSFDGTHTTGRAAIAASHQELFERFLGNTCLVGRITRIKFLRQDVAVLTVVSGTRFGQSRVVRRPSIQTYVAVERGGEWRFSAFHNGRIDRVQDRHLLRLAWLGFETFVLRR